MMSKTFGFAAVTAGRAADSTTIKVIAILKNILRRIWF
jgi:hypothetical protein